VEPAGLFRPLLEQEFLPVIDRFGNIPPSVQTQFLVPRAVSLAFGALFAAVVTLLVVPSGYIILEDIQRFFCRKRQLSAKLTGNGAKSRGICRQNPWAARSGGGRQRADGTLQSGGLRQGPAPPPAGLRTNWHAARAFVEG